MDTVPPLAGWVTSVTVSCSSVSGALVSLASTFSVLAVRPRAPRTYRPHPSADSFTAVTVAVTVAVSVPPLLSVTV